MTTAPSSSLCRTLPLLTLVLVAASTLTGPSLAREAVAEAAGTPYLVRDVDTTDEPFYTACDVEPCTPIPYYGSQPEQLTAWNDLLFFVANDREHGFEPWVSDGTAAGTRMLGDLCPGECESQVVLLEPSRHGLLFWGLDGTSSCRLWRTDGASVAPVGDVVDGSRCLAWEPDVQELFDLIVPAVSFDSFVVFEHEREPLDPIQDRHLLIRSDGTASGTEEVLELCRGRSCFDRIAEFELTDRGLYFVVSRNSQEDELWLLETPTGVPSLVFEHRVIYDLAPLGRDLLFVAGDRRFPDIAATTALYRTDGTPDGTGPVRDLSGPESCAAGSGAWAPEDLTRLGDQVFFRTRDCSDRLGLWRTDGTADGTVQVTAPPGTDLGSSYGFEPFVPVAGRLQFGSGINGPTVQRAVHLFDVGPAGDVRRLLALPIGDLTAAGDRSFFSAGAVGPAGAEPWVSDGTFEGTARLGDLDPGTASSSPRGFVRAGERVFFSAETEELGRELWAIDLDELAPPRPPYTRWIRSEQIPGFRVQVRITGGGGPIEGSPEDGCIPETLCVSGALPGRSEVFVRVVGPKPNGFLWPTLVKFSTSTVEVWVERESSGEVRYYRLAGATPGVDTLPGLFDRTGFEAP